MANDWDRIRQALDADTSITEGRRREIWRWTALARDWLDAAGIDILTLTSGDLVRYVNEVEPVSGPKNPYQRRSALNQLRAAALTVAPRVAKRTDTLAARLDAVPARSPLGKAIARVLARAKTPNERARLATLLGAFLEWCEKRELTPAECWPGDLDVYRRQRLADGYRSPGDYRRIAGWLLEELASR